ncbi:cytochrome c-type biogenesis protein CcmH [Ancylobacter sp. 6x-1]|uniref:Cytochrome c-type biogenesis protein n=1 Tax=Ancylobacter crimeensis TaxID=2579147 RepID=A0ABT0D8Q0_9HYPH|nr:cytochrome c-type biogenesis protein [Ancylobacter crimeensis]MCK0196328.1 cytochrome c-type biogenesis protein CcmH [Ancylobacter crimeensis]
MARSIGRGVFRLLLVLTLALGALGPMVRPVFAVNADEMLSDPALEERARTLSRELRCMVCQNQSIDDSDAPLARDLRLLVRERLKAGDDDQQVLDYLVARYGEFVLMRPTLHGANLFLWIAPFIVLALGGAAMVVMARRARSAAAPLTREEEERLSRLVTPSDRNG